MWWVPQEKESRLCYLCVYLHPLLQNLACNRSYNRYSITVEWAINKLITEIASDHKETQNNLIFFNLKKTVLKENNSTLVKILSHT